MRLTRHVLTVCSLVPILLTAPGPAALAAEPAGRQPAAPTVVVQPATNLQPDTQVQITARGLPRSTPMFVVLCDGPRDSQIFDTCQTRLAEGVSSDARGRLSLSVGLPAVAYYYQYGRRALYCRGDTCQVFVYWYDQEGQLAGVAESATLEFQGSPATITATPDTDLVDGSRVRVTGRAEGSTSRYVTIVQVVCVEKVGENSCFSDLPLASVPLRADDTYAADVRVVRFMPDGYDCRSDDEDFLDCRLTARFLIDGYQQPDVTFGDPEFGDPSSRLDFRQPA